MWPGHSVGIVFVFSDPAHLGTNHFSLLTFCFVSVFWPFHPTIAPNGLSVRKKSGVNVLKKLLFQIYQLNLSHLLQDCWKTFSNMSSLYN